MGRSLRRAFLSSSPSTPQTEPLFAVAPESIEIVPFGNPTSSIMSSSTAKRGFHDQLLDHPRPLLPRRPDAVRSSSLSNEDVNVRSVREMLPYLSKHRGSTLVVHVPHTLTRSRREFGQFVQDLVLIHTLGVRLVLVLDCESRVRELLDENGVTWRVRDGERVASTDSVTWDMVAAQEVRMAIEQQLSKTHMSKGKVKTASDVRVISGNFVRAQPKGLSDGEDFDLTGIVRSIDRVRISEILKQGDIVLLGHMAHSNQGVTYACNSISLAEACAVKIGADKLVYLHEGESLRSEESGERVDLHLDSAKKLIERMDREIRDVVVGGRAAPHELLHRYMRSAVEACRRGVRRTHLVNRHIDGALLVELFSRDGHGLLISRDVYEGVRRAAPHDASSIKELVRPLEKRDILVPRSKEYITDHSHEFIVVERDGHVIACAQCIIHEERMAEIACVAVDPKFRHGGQANALMSYLKRELVAMKVRKAFVLTTKSYDWFVERGFAAADVGDLPEARRETYNRTRRPKVLMQELRDFRQISDEELFFDKSHIAEPPTAY